MRRKSPMEVEPDWKHPLPMPMPYQPVCVTELEALNRYRYCPMNQEFSCGQMLKEDALRIGNFLPA